MADNNWTILPEFDEGHQNRYIVMVGDRAVADNVAKKFPKICSQPFELKNEKYPWGLYVDNSTRDERKNIYKFFLGETDSVQELKKEEEIKEVISELNIIFSTLTKDEQRQIEEEIPEKIKSIEKFAEKKSGGKTPAAGVISAENISDIKAEEKPQDAAIVPPAVTHPEALISSPETKTEILPSSIPVETKQERPPQIKIEIERFGEPASSVSPVQEKKEVSVAALPVVKEMAVSSQSVPSVSVEEYLNYFPLNF